MENNQADYLEKAEGTGVCKKTSIGGQALIEGLMMLGPDKQSIAVRNSDGEIVLTVKDRPSFANRFNIPFLRGIVRLVTQLKTGVGAISYSADIAMQDEKTSEDKKKSRFDQFADRHPQLVMGFTLVFSIALSVAIFILLPSALTDLIRKVTGFGSGQQKGGMALALSFIEGFVRIAIFIMYLWLASLSKDIKRVWMFHGSEHKTIAAYEADMEGEIDGSVVRFDDGSEANFEEMVVINRGKGNILLRTSDDFGTNDWESDKGTVSQNNENEKGTGIDSLDFDLAGACDITIDQSKDGKTHWKADGPVSFMKNLSIEREGSTLAIRLNSYKSNKFFGIGFGNSQGSGTMRLSVAHPVLTSLNAKIKGAADIRSAIDVKEANVTITGSGNTTLGNVKSLQLKVAGSGDCDFGEVEDASISIAGSGDVKIRELSKTGYVRIAGSGDVSILSGEAERLEISVFGSGDIDAKHLTVDELDIGNERNGRRRHRPCTQPFRRADFESIRSQDSL
jgi:hypothetical protein